MRRCWCLLPPRPLGVFRGLKSTTYFCCHERLLPTHAEVECAHPSRQAEKECLKGKMAELSVRPTRQEGEAAPHSQRGWGAG